MLLWLSKNKLSTSTLVYPSSEEGQPAAAAEEALVYVVSDKATAHVASLYLPPAGDGTPVTTTIMTCSQLVAYLAKPGTTPNLQLTVLIDLNYGNITSDIAEAAAVLLRTKVDQPDKHTTVNFLALSTDPTPAWCTLWAVEPEGLLRCESRTVVQGEAPLTATADSVPRRY